MLVVGDPNMLYILFIAFADIYFIRTLMGINLGIYPLSFFFYNLLSIACTFSMLITLHPETIFRTTIGDARESLCVSIVLQSIASCFFTNEQFLLLLEVTDAVAGVVKLLLQYGRPE